MLLCHTTIRLIPVKQPCGTDTNQQHIRKPSEQELERWLSVWEHWLPLLRTWVSIPASERQLTAISYSSSRVSDSSLTFLGIVHIHTVHRHTWRQTNHTHKIKIHKSKTTKKNILQTSQTDSCYPSGHTDSCDLRQWPPLLLWLGIAAILTNPCD